MLKVYCTNLIRVGAGKWAGLRLDAAGLQSGKRPAAAESLAENRIVRLFKTLNAKCQIFEHSLFATPDFRAG